MIFLRKRPNRTYVQIHHAGRDQMGKNLSFLIASDWPDSGAHPNPPWLS